MRAATKPFASLFAFLLAFAFALALSGAYPAHADMSVGEMAADEAAQAPEEKVEFVELNLIQSGHYKPAGSEAALRAQADDYAMTDAQAESVKNMVSTVLSNWNGTTVDEYGGIKIDISRQNPRIRATTDNEQRIAKIVSDYVDDHPELFFLSGGCRMISMGNGDEFYYTTLSLVLSYPIEDIPEMRAAYAERVDEAVSWVGDIEVASDIDKAKAVHDYLVRTCYYNDSAARAGHPNAYGSYDPWNAYGALVLGEPVCQGYSLAFKACMSECGVDSICVSQWIGSSGHEWNKVKLGDSWYNLDVTWDDNKTDGENGNQPEKTPDVSFFLKSDEWFRTHPDEKGFHGPSPAWEQPANVDAVNAQYDDAAVDSWPEFDGSQSGASIKSFELAASTLDMAVGETATVQIGAYTPAWLNSAFVAEQATWSLVGGPSDVIDIDSTGAITAKAPGTATVACTIGEHQQTCDVSVAKARITSDNTTITLSASQYTYNGAAQEPGVTVMLGDQALIADTDYTVRYSNNTNAGNATVAVIAKGDYIGTMTTTFTIKPKAVTPAVTLSKAAFTYNGKVQKPTITVKVGSTKLAASNYTLAWASGCKAVGAYKVTVKLKGNYSGSKAMTYKINPKGTSLVSVAAASRGFTAKWKKQATQTTGYQVQYSLKKSFKSKKTLTIAKTKTLSKKVVKLKAKKRYYVRVRTYKKVGTVKYFSAWSKAKAVITKA